MVGRDDGGGRFDIALLVCWWHCHQNSVLLYYVLLVSQPHPFGDAFFIYGDSTQRGGVGVALAGQ